MLSKIIINNVKELGEYCNSIDACCEECNKKIECNKYLKTINNLTPCGILELVKVSKLN